MTPLMAWRTGTFGQCKYEETHKAGPTNAAMEMGDRQGTKSHTDTVVIPYDRTTARRTVEHLRGSWSPVDLRRLWQSADRSAAPPWRSRRKGNARVP